MMFIINKWYHFSLRDKNGPYAMKLKVISWSPPVLHLSNEDGRDQVIVNTTATDFLSAIPVDDLPEDDDPHASDFT